MFEVRQIDLGHLVCNSDPDSIAFSDSVRLKWLWLNKVGLVWKELA